MPRAAILGCDLSALLAAHACVHAGWSFHIFAEGEPTLPHATQPIFRAVPGIDIALKRVSVKSEGTEDGYRQKVYGPEFNGPLGFGSGDAHVADARAVYRWLWEKYAANTYNNVLSASNYDMFTEDLSEYHQAVFSALPIGHLCNAGHRFDTRQYWSVFDSPERGTRSPVRVADNTIVNDGTDFVGWYRAANVFGQCSVEWPAHKGSARPPIPGVHKSSRAIGTNCDCYPNVIRIGDLGNWQDRLLADDVYWTVTEVLIALGQE